MTDASAPERPTSAGMYDFYLGGTAHRPADRAAAEQVVQLIPAIADGAWANRGFLQRAVRRLAADFGVRQFLDIGAGLPTQRNTHDVAAESVPDARVVYVDIDPAVVDQGREVLGDAPGVTVIEGDVRKPETILTHPEARRLIDFSEPVAVLLVAVLHFVTDDEDPWALVSRYVAAVPSGSFVAVSHSSMDEQVPEQVRQMFNKIYANTAHPPTDRSRTEIERFFQGLELVPPHPGAAPAVTFIGLWGAEDMQAADSDGARLGYAGLARKP